MLRASAQRVLQQSGLLQAACYSSAKLPEDYNIAIRQAGELGTAHVDTPDKEIGYCAGVPMETFNRKARIFSPARTAGQQGIGNTIYNNKGRPWKIAFETQSKWINPLMGWTSTADPLENVSRSSLQFNTQEEAIAFCKKYGWDFVVVPPHQRRTTRQKRFNGYGDNFSMKRAGVPDLSSLPSARGVGGTGASKQ